MRIGSGINRNPRVRPPSVGLFPTVRPPLLRAVTTEDIEEGREKGRGRDKERRCGWDVREEEECKGRSELERDLRSWVRGQGRIAVSDNLGEGLVETSPFLARFFSPRGLP